MSAIRALRLMLTTATIVEAVRWVLSPSHSVDTFAFVGGYVILGAFAFLAARDRIGYRYVFARTWLFVGLWFAFGVAHFIFDRGELPPNWSPEMTWQAFGGYVFATVLFLPLAFASSGLGVLVAHLLSRLRRGPSTAA